VTGGAVVVVELGGRRVALDADVVTEVSVLQTLTPVPLGPPEILGLTQLRGQILPVLDAETGGGGARGARSGEALVVVDCHGVRAAILVDGVIGVEGQAGELVRLDLAELVERLSTR
jgi:purine-binding chemotaxis protein CheW